MNCNLMQCTRVRGRLSGTYLQSSRCLLQSDLMYFVTGLVSLNKFKKCILEFFEFTHIIRHGLWFFIEMCVHEYVQSRIMYQVKKGTTRWQH